MEGMICPSDNLVRLPIHLRFNMTHQLSISATHTFYTTCTRTLSCSLSPTPILSILSHQNNNHHHHHNTIWGTTDNGTFLLTHGCHPSLVEISSLARPCPGTPSIPHALHQVLDIYYKCTCSQLKCEAVHWSHTP